MRRKMVAGNWKMNLTRAEGAALAQGLVRAEILRPEVDLVLFPQYLSLQTVTEHLKGTHIVTGAQDVFWLDSGAFTGKVSARMIADAGATYCLIGHSETRGKFGKIEVPESTVSYFAETDETVRLKLLALLHHGLKPLLCVGETLAEREAGQTDKVIETQLKGALHGIEGCELHELVVAYEPVWAIGTGQTCDAQEAGRVCREIRKQLATILDEEASEAIRVLYGGSVKASNSDELFRQEGIDGGLVGGASLNAEEFSRIILSA